MDGLDDRPSEELETMLHDSRAPKEERARARAILDERRRARSEHARRTLELGAERRLWAAGGAACLALGALARPIAERALEPRVLASAALAVIGGAIAYHALRGPRAIGAGAVVVIASGAAMFGGEPMYVVCAIAGGALATFAALWRPTRAQRPLSLPTAIPKVWVVLAEGEEGTLELSIEGAGRVEVRAAARQWWRFGHVKIGMWRASPVRFTAPGPWVLLGRSVDRSADVVFPLAREIADPSLIEVAVVGADGTRRPVPRDAWRYDRTKNAIVLDGEWAPAEVVRVEVVRS